MKERLARLVGFLAPIGVAAMAAALSAGLVEGAVYFESVEAAVVSTGFAAPYALALGALALLLVCALWAAWRPRELLAGLREEPDGVTPRLAGWLGFCLLAIAVAGAVAFNFVRWLARNSEQSNVIGLAAALGFVVVGIALVVASRPAVDLLSLGFRTLARRPRLTRFMRPMALFIEFGVLAAICMYLSWRFSFVPRVGELELGVELYVAVWLATLAVGFALARRIVRRARMAIISGALALACIAVVGNSLTYRERDPAVMLNVWGTETVGGMAIDRMYGLETIREAFVLDMIPPEGRTGEVPRDVLLLTIDTMRADQLPMYGGKAEMPRLARLAGSSIVFDWAFSPSNVTRRSLPAIITGLNPLRIRGRLRRWALVMDPRHVLLAERFRAAGYDTAGFFCCGSHFDKQRIGTTRGIDHLVLERNERRLIETAAGFLGKRQADKQRRPLFTWIHVYAPHDWHRDHKKFIKSDKKASYASSYRKALTRTDRWLAPLTTYLERTPVKESTIVAVTSDHGEGLGDRGHKFHSTSLHNSQIHVPLFIRVPGDLSGKRIEQPVSLVDVAPTLLDLAGFEVPAGSAGAGASLAPLMRGDVPKHPDAVVLSHQIRDRSIPERIDAIVMGRYKLIVPDSAPAMLFDYLADPNETRNLAAEQPDRVTRMRATLREQTAGLSGMSPL